MSEPGLTGSTDSGSKRFQPERRLLKPSHYRQVFDKTEFKTQTAEFLILATTSTEAVARLGLVISKKSAKLAVERNRIKRIIRESFRHHQGRIKPLDLVILSRPGAKLLSNAELRQMMDNLWYKLKPVPKHGKKGGRKPQRGRK